MSKHTPDLSECRCEIKWSADIWYIDYCPLHAAAPEMYELLRDFVIDEGCAETGERNCGKCLPCQANALLARIDESEV